MEASVPLVDAAGWSSYIVQEVGNPYISGARATMLRKALDAKADVVVFLDYDLSWAPGDLLKLLEAPGGVVSGTYRFKEDEESYMGTLITDPAGTPYGRADGCLAATFVPGGFLKITAEAVDLFMEAYPELLYGPRYAPAVDLFQHGAHKNIWYGEDYAFSRRWREMGGSLWIKPDLEITHWAGDKPYPGNFDKFLRKPSEGRPRAD